MPLYEQQMQLSLFSASEIEVCEVLYRALSKIVAEVADLRRITRRELRENCPSAVTVEKARGAVKVSMSVVIVGAESKDSALVIVKLVFPLRGEPSAITAYLRKFEIPEKGVYVGKAGLLVPATLSGDYFPEPVPPTPYFIKYNGNGKKRFVARCTLAKREL